MKPNTFLRLGPACAFALTFAAGAALAKLPPLTPEAQAKAAEAKAKTDYTTKVDAYKLCQSQDKVAARYHTSMKELGKETKPAASVPACADPGPMPPLEAAGAHSPPQTAASPPNTAVPQSSEPKK